MISKTQELHAAILNADLKAVQKVLQDKSVNVNEFNDSGKASLHLVADVSHFGVEQDIAEEITSYEGVEIDLRDHVGRTPLQIASMTNNVGVFQVLIKNGAKVDSRDENGWSPLHWVALSRSMSMLKLLVDAGVDMSAVDKWGRTALHVFAGDIPQEMLRNQSDDVEEECYVNQSVLQARSEVSDIAKSLLLLYRVCNSKTQREGVNFVRYLVCNGANPWIKNHDGKTVADVVQNDGVKYYLQNQAQQDYQNYRRNRSKNLGVKIVAITSFSVTLVLGAVTMFSVMQTTDHHKSIDMFLSIVLASFLIASAGFATWLTYLPEPKPNMQSMVAVKQNQHEQSDLSR